MAYETTGLVDAHVHLALDMTDELEPGEHRYALHLRTLRAAGVTAVRDAGRPPSYGLPPIDKPTSTFIAPEHGFLPHLFTPTPPNELIATATRQIDEGATWIKLIADFPGPDMNFFTARPAYDPDLLKELVEAVHAREAKVMAHVSTRIVTDLVDAGVDSIEHGPMLDRTTVEKMAERGTIWCPTIATITHHVGVLPVWRELVPYAVEIGVPVVAGSDELPIPSTHLEVVALHEVGGLTPAQAFAAATDVAREALDLPANPDDVVTYARDPREDLSVLQTPILGASPDDAEPAPA